MKVTLKVFVVFLCLAQGFVLTASEMKRPNASAAPQIRVKNKSDFLNVAPLQRLNMSSAFNTLTGETLVVWKEHDSVAGNWVQGKILSANGATTTKKFLPIRPECCLGLGVTFNPTKREYLVVFKRNQGISGQRFNTLLKSIGNEFQIVPFINENRNHHPSVIFDPNTDGYALAWDRDQGIAAALLNSSGKLTGSIVAIKQNPGSNGYYDDWSMDLSRGFPPSVPRILGFAHQPSSGKFLLVFQQRFSPTQGDYWLATLDPTLKNFKPSDLVKINKSTVSFVAERYWGFGRKGWGASLAVLSNGSAIVYYGDLNSIKQRKIDSNGRLTSAVLPAFSGALKNSHLYDPKVVFSTISSGTTGLLTARISDFPKPSVLYGQVLDSLGRPIGDPVVLDPSDVIDPNCPMCGTSFQGSNLVALPRKASDKSLRFVYLFLDSMQAPQQGTDPNAGDRIVKTDVEVIP